MKGHVMSIWEEIYSKHKETGRVSMDPQSEPELQNSRVTAVPPGNPSKCACNGSLEDAYYESSRPQQTRQQAPEPEPQVPPKPPARARFIPRTTSGGLTTPYPAMLSKLHNSLSGTWANMMLETGQGAQTLLVCGSAGQEGVTTISFYLAMFLSKEYSMKVLYVDTNLNHKAIPRIQNLPGVYSFVSDQRDLRPLILQTEYPGLYLLPSGSGTIAKNIGGNMLSREPIETMLQFCRSNFDMTIIDGQPLVSSPVMFEFARAADLTLLVCRYGHSRHEVSKMAIEKLKKYGISSIGVILNDRKFPVPQKLYDFMG